MLRPIVLFRQCRRKTQSRIKTDTSVFRGGSGNSKRETSFGCSIGRGGFVETRHFVAEHTQVYREMVCGDEVGFANNVASAAVTARQLVARKSFRRDASARSSFKRVLRNSKRASEEMHNKKPTAVSFSRPINRRVFRLFCAQAQKTDTTEGLLRWSSFDSTRKKTALFLAQRAAFPAFG